MKTLFFVFICLVNISISFADTFSHQDWVDEFKKKGLSNQIELINLEQSRLEIQERIGQIAPSLSLGTVIETSISGPIGLLNGLTNLVGFMLPSRWFNWRESQMYYLSQYYSYMAMRGNFILLAEELYLNLKKTIRIKNALKVEFDELTILVRSIEFRERVGELPKGTFARIKARHLSNQYDLEKLNQLIGLYYIQMNKLLQDDEFQLVDSIEISERPSKPIDNDFDFHSQEESLIELKSMNYLIKASTYSKKARTWSFLDPGSRGFGFGYMASNQMATNDILILQSKMDQLSFDLKAKFKSISLEENYLLEQHTLLSDALTITKDRKNQIMVDYRLKGKIDADDYIENLDNYLKFTILLNANEIAAEYLQAQKERIALTNFYDHLDDLIPKRDIENLKRYQRREDKLINRNGGIK